MNTSCALHPYHNKPRYRDQCFSQALRELGLDEGIYQEVGAGYAEGVEVAHGHEGPLEVRGEVEYGDKESKLGDRSSQPRHCDQCFAQALREHGLNEGVDQKVCAGYAEGVEVAHGHEGPLKV